MLNKEEIEKAKKECETLIKCIKSDLRCEDTEDNFVLAESIEILLQYIKELETTKGMKEAIELSNMDIKSLLSLKYDNKKLQDEVKQLGQENNKLNRMIDEMATYIGLVLIEENDTMFCNDKNSCDENCDKCIKQYFEKKVEESEC